ncbi:MAG: hypothetical protein HN465_03245, partial [Nitrospina sp.]|nr:hypothetical protein [Nitrospina sp.]
MIIKKKNIWALFFMVCFFLYTSQLLAQEDKGWFFEKFFSSTPDDSIENDPPLEIDTDSITESPVTGSVDIAKPKRIELEPSNKDTVEGPLKEPIIESEDFSKSEGIDLEASNKNAAVPPLKKFIIEKKNLVSSMSNEHRILKKDMVVVPPLDKKKFLDAGDYRDPFMLLRGGHENTGKVLKPGVTVDGVQFNSYNNSDAFIEKVYRDSRFRVKDVFGDVTHLEGGGCLYCHRGIERISKNHKFRCTKCHEGNRRGKTLLAAHKNLVSNP